MLFVWNVNYSGRYSESSELFRALKEFLSVLFLPPFFVTSLIYAFMIDFVIALIQSCLAMVCLYHKIASSFKNGKHMCKIYFSPF